MGQIVRGSDCHSQLSTPPPGGAENGSDCSWVGLSQPTFRPTSKGSNGVVGQFDPSGVGLSQYVNVCGANRYSVGWCRSECQSV
jgi:hypothetical protein